MNIGSKIKGLRIQKEWTQKELASRIKVAQNTLSDYERGATAISLEIIDNLAKVFDVDKSYFLSESEKNKSYDNYEFLFKTIKLIIEDCKVNTPEDISKEMMGVIESAVKETVRRIKIK